METSQGFANRSQFFLSGSDLFGLQVGFGSLGLLWLCTIVHGSKNGWCGDGRSATLSGSDEKTNSGQMEARDGGRLREDLRIEPNCL